MLISADCIESTSANGAITTDKGRGESSKSDKSTRLKKKKKLPSHRNMAQMNQSDHVYKVCKSLSKLTCNQTKISWKCFLEEVTCVTEVMSLLLDNVIELLTHFLSLSLLSLFDH